MDQVGERWYSRRGKRTDRRPEMTHEIRIKYTRRTIWIMQTDVEQSKLVFPHNSFPVLDPKVYGTRPLQRWCGDFPTP